MAKKKKRRGHYCRICHSYRPNQAFSGKGHASHVCKHCQKLPKAERFHIEAMDRMWDFLFRQSHVSDQNIAQLVEYVESEDRGVSEFASLVLELVRLRPHKKKRYRGLRATHPDLWRRLSEAGIIEVWEFSDEEACYPFDPLEIEALQEGLGLEDAGPEDSEIPF